MNDKLEELMSDRPTILIEMSSSGLPATSKTLPADSGLPIARPEMVEVVTWNEKWEPVVVLVQKF